MSNHGTAAARDRASVIVGVLLLLLAAILWYDAVNLGRTVAYGIGSDMMPKVIGVGLSVLGILSIISGLRNPARETEPADWRAVVIILGGFLALTVMIGLNVGFIPAMTVLFAVTSFAFGRRALLADVAIGFVLATLTYLLFSKLLALSLPRGPLEQIFG
ncbi:MAG: tripartite tricarboxylate transporter TctB family protein [Proteobacteria bacterium]|nr:tripartite tricarboxylate transporter TctB family protein [Pseudomonadota bacterium]